MKKHTIIFCITLFLYVCLIGCVYFFPKWITLSATVFPYSPSESSTETGLDETDSETSSSPTTSSPSPQASVSAVTPLDLIPTGENLAAILPDTTQSFYYITYLTITDASETTQAQYQYFVRKYDLTTRSTCLEVSYQPENAYWYQFQLRENGIITFWNNGALEYLDADLQHCTYSTPHTAPGLLSSDAHMFAWCAENQLYYLLDDASEAVVVSLPTDTIGDCNYCYLNTLDVLWVQGEKHYVASMYVSTPDLQSGTILMDVLTQTVYSCQPNYNSPQFFGKTFRYFEYVPDRGSTLLWLGTLENQLYTLESENEPFLHSFNSSDFMTVHQNVDGQITADFVSTESLNTGYLDAKRISWMSLEEESYTFFYTLTPGQTYLFPVYSERDNLSRIYLIDVSQAEDVSFEYQLVSHSTDNTVIPFEINEAKTNEPALLEAQTYADNLAKTYGFDAIYIGQSCPEAIGNYSCTSNSDVYMVWQALQTLSETLQLYPQSFFKQLLLDENDKIELYLAGTLSASDASGLNQAGGIVYEDDSKAMIAFAIGTESGNYTLSSMTINHEFSHLIDRKLMTFPELNMEAMWNLQNPSDFHYADTYQDYESNTLWDHYINSMPNCTSPHFLSRYSTTYFREDRAELFSYAMSYIQMGNINYFTDDCPYLRNKLELYCSQLRQVLDTTRWPTQTSWEAALH